MLSLPKLIVLIVIVVVVWKVFKWVNRTNQLRARREAAEREPPPPPGVRAAPNAEDMVRCPVCDTFVTARGARHCGREDCLYPR